MSDDQEELAGSLLPPARDRPDQAGAAPAVMDRPTRAHRYESPHVHDPDGTCVRNRFRTPCDAPYQPDRKESR